MSNRSASKPRLLPRIFWAALIFSFVVATLPQAPAMPGGDKFWHMLAFALLAGLGAAAYPAQPLWRIGLGLSGYGALIELVQMIPRLGRHAEMLDWIADTVAAAAVLCIAAMIRDSNARSGNSG